MSLRKFHASVCDDNFPSLVASLFSWWCLTASTSSFLLAAMNLRPPSLTVYARTLLCTHSLHSFSFPPRPLRTAFSRVPHMVCFGNRQPLNRMSALSHKNIIVCNVVSMLSYRFISRAQLHEVIRWPGCTVYCTCTPAAFPARVDPNRGSEETVRSQGVL